VQPRRIFSDWLNNLGAARPANQTTQYFGHTKLSTSLNDEDQWPNSVDDSVMRSDLTSALLTQH